MDQAFFLLQLKLSTMATLRHNFLFVIEGGLCIEVSIRVECMDWRMVGTKNPGCCAEVAIVGRFQ